MKSIFAILLLCVLFGAPQVWADDTNGVMMVVKGDVKVTASKGGKTEAAKVGRKVFAGDTITAGPDARAKIVMSDKNVLNISPDSKITIEKYTNDPKSNSHSAELKVEYGKVRATVEQKYDGEKNKFNIRTPTAVAGVRGTDFITSYNPVSRQSAIITFSGTVAVGAPGPKGEILNPVFVKKGQETTINEGKSAEAPKAVPKEELNKQNKESAAETAKPAADQSAAPGSDKGDKKDDKKDEKKDKESGDKAKDSKDSKDSKDAKDAKQDGKDGKDGKDAKQEPKDANKDSKDAKQGSANNSDGTKASDSTTAKGDASAPANSDSRAPASTSDANALPTATAGSMMDSRDLGPDLSRDIQVGTKPPVIPITNLNQYIPTTMPTPIPFIENFNGGKVKTTITISK